MLSDQKKNDFVVDISSSLRTAMELFQKNGKKTVFITNNTNKLLGVLSDGDIRRYLLKNSNIDTSVKDAMNSSPMSLSVESSKSSILDFFRKEDVSCLPIIDLSGILIDIIIRNDARLISDVNNFVVIMAGGFGTRLGEMTKNCPKPMIKIEGIPIIEHIINNFKKYGFKKFIITTHYLSQIIKDYLGDGSKLDIEITYVYEDEPLGTGGSLTLMPDNFTDLPIIVTNGDIITKLNYGELLEFHNENKNDITMCLHLYENKIDFGVVEVENGVVKKLVEKPTVEYLINSGVYVLNSSQLEKFDKNSVLTMPEIIEHCIDMGSNVGSFILADYWIDVGRLQDLQKAKNDIK